MLIDSTRVTSKLVVQTDKVGRVYDTYIYSVATRRTYHISSATSKGVAEENHRRLVRIVRDVLDRLRRDYVESIPGQLSLVFEGQ